MDDEALAERTAGRWALLRDKTEHQLQKHPGLLLGAAIALVLLGYALPLAFPLMTAVLSYHVLESVLHSGWGAVTASAGSIGALLLCASVSVSLWRMRVLEPGGEPLLQAQAPALFAAVDDLRVAFQSPPMTDIHLTDTVDVKVRRIPCNGYPLRFRQVVMAGFPALHCLTLEQFQCALAAVLGGLSVVRADVGSWLVQMSDTWRQYQQAVVGKWTPAALVYRSFLFVYVPLLSAIESRLNVGHCLRRDGYALEVADDDLVAQTMAAEVVMQRFMATYYWPTVYKAAEHSVSPTFKVFRNLESVFRRKLDAELIQAWLREAYAGKWMRDAQDIGLKLRLNEIGHSAAHYRIPEEQSAAQALLGASYQWIVDRCDARWAEEHREQWLASHLKLQQQYARLEQLRDMLQQHGLFGENAVHYAALVKRCGTEQEALQAYETILALNPDDAKINFGVGKYLLACRDARGVAILEQAMRLDKRYVDHACRLISEFSSRAQTPARNRVSDANNG